MDRFVDDINSVDKETTSALLDELKTTKKRLNIVRGIVDELLNVAEKGIKKIKDME